MRLIKTLHRAYKFFISPLFGTTCRFEPYCSDYAVKALEEHGFFKGIFLALWRLIRCNPYSAGGYDPVPKNGS